MKQSHLNNNNTDEGKNNRPDTGEVSFIEVINVLLRHRILLTLIPILTFTVTVGYTFFQPRTYTATVAFTPQTSDQSGPLTSGLAAQFGFNISLGNGGQSSDFYAYLIQSRLILKAIAEMHFSFVHNEEQLSGTLSDLLEIDIPEHDERIEVIISSLRDLISVDTDRATELITFSVKTQWALLSEQIAQCILDLVNRFNSETRQSQAGEERKFVESRLNEVHSELREAEDVLQEFLHKNRQWQDSPELLFTHDRLQRNIELRQQVSISLTQAYEQARIDEIRDTSMITIIEPPEKPAIPDRRRLKLKALMALLVGGIIGVLLAFGKEFLAIERQQEANAFAEFDRLRNDTIADFSKLWRGSQKSSKRDF